MYVGVHIYTRYVHVCVYVCTLFDKLNLYKIGKIRITRLIFPKTRGRVMGREARRNDNCRTRDEYPIRRVTCHMTKITVNNGRHIITSIYMHACVYIYIYIYIYCFKSFVVYQFTCASCRTRYVGRTHKHFDTRITEHFGSDSSSSLV